MAPDDNDESELPELEDTPEMRRLLESVSRLSSEQKNKWLERAGFRSEIIPRYSREPPEDGEKG
jgi:hypothetical protein